MRGVIGGFVQTYQVIVDPMKLRAYGIPLAKVTQVIRDSNRDVGGRVVEMAETEYMVRGKGYLRGMADIESLVVKSEKGTPVRMQYGGDLAPGFLELAQARLHLIPGQILPSPSTFNLQGLWSVR